MTHCIAKTRRVEREERSDIGGGAVRRGRTLSSRATLAEIYVLDTHPQTQTHTHTHTERIWLYPRGHEARASSFGQKEAASFSVGQYGA